MLVQEGQTSEDIVRFQLDTNVPVRTIDSSEIITGGGEFHEGALIFGPTLKGGSKKLAKLQKSVCVNSKKYTIMYPIHLNAQNSLNNT